MDLRFKKDTMQYAIIQFAGKQFKVSAGDTITTDRSEAETDSTVTVSDVLFIGDTESDKNMLLGLPLVPNASVSLKVVEHGRGEKIRVVKYKSKSRYRKVQGHKQHETTFEVTGIKLK